MVFKLNPAGNETVLHAFTGGTDGNSPYASLIRDGAGNLYGTTAVGGAHGLGVVFKLDPAGNETVLYTFTGGARGAYPGGGLIWDTAGNLYGSTGAAAITSGLCGSFGCGVVFKLDPSGNELVLYTFTGGADGANPSAGLILDASGNLGGTALYGGSDFGGVVFKVDQKDREIVLHAFTGIDDGYAPDANLILDRTGNAYGTTVSGGTTAHGAVFKLSRP